MPKPVLFDLSHFIETPMRTGVQRVCYEIITRWPERGGLLPVHVGQDYKLYLLPITFLDVFADYFRTPWEKLAEAKERVKEQAKVGRRKLSRRHYRNFHALLRAEALNDEPRLSFVQDLLRNGYEDWFRVLIYDLLPWTHPEYFPTGASRDQFEYLRMTRRAKYRSHISEQTRLDFMRVLGDPTLDAGVVLPLGADSLGIATPEFNPERFRFAMIGTIEPRKNHTATLDAFEELWKQGVEAELIFAGGMGWIQEETRKRILHLNENERRFRWMKSISDSDMVELIRSCRATIYPATAEGYGLPPVESMALGVPAIATKDLPSIAMLENKGHIRIDRPDSGLIRDAVLCTMDNHAARRITEEISTLKLPLWSEFGIAMADWVLGR